MKYTFSTFRKFPKEMCDDLSSKIHDLFSYRITLMTDRSEVNRENSSRIFKKYMKHWGRKHIENI